MTSQCCISALRPEAGTLLTDTDPFCCQCLSTGREQTSRQETEKTCFFPIMTPHLQRGYLYQNGLPTGTSGGCSREAGRFSTFSIAEGRLTGISSALPQYPPCLEGINKHVAFPLECSARSASKAQQQQRVRTRHVHHPLALQASSEQALPFWTLVSCEPQAPPPPIHSTDKPAAKPW